MKNKEKSPNRKAFPQFVLMTVSGIALGILCGMVIDRFRGVDAAQGAQRLQSGLLTAAPWLLVGLALILGGAALVLYKQARALVLAWNGEDEEPADLAGRRFTQCLMLTGVLDGVCFFSLTLLPLMGGLRGTLFLLLDYGFAMVLVTLLQQKAVDLNRQLNPEKQGSVYEIRFQQKLLASCDENELRLAGQAAYKTYRVVTYACIILWALLLVVNLFLPIGVLPALVVLVIWLLQQIVFNLEALRLDRRS